MFQFFTDSAGPSNFVFLILTLVFGLGAFAIGSLIAAACMQRAVKWLGFKSMVFWDAIRFSVLINVVVTSLSLLIGVNYGLNVRLLSPSGPSSIDFNFLYAFPPIFYLYQLVVTLLIAAAIFVCVVKPRDDKTMRISFPEGFAIASVFYGMTAFICLVIFAFVGLMLILAYPTV